MRTHLLGPKAMKSYAEARNTEEFLELLCQTQYREEIEQSSERISAMMLERAFYRRLLKRLDRVIRVAPTGIAEFLLVFYHVKLEVQNLKRILRGKFSKTPVERIKGFLVPISPYLSTDFEDLVRAETLEDLVRLLRGTAYSAVREGLALCETYDALWPIEARLNHIYVEMVQRSISKIPLEDRTIVRRIIETETDIENLLLAINLRRKTQETPLPPLESIFQLTFEISQRIIEKLITSKDISSVLKALKTPYAEIVKPIIHEDEALARTNLRKYAYKEAREETMRNDFGFPCVMSYLISCETEKDDLTGIAWGKENRVEPKKILRYSVIPTYASMV